MSSTTQLRRAARVILIGAPGVGKGTQSERLLARFPQLQSISTGDLLRTNVKRRTALGIQAEGIMKSGGLVADDIMMRLISNELHTRGWLLGQRPPVTPLLASEDPSASFILDGYPRNATQAHGLESIVPINLAISIVTPFSVILERIAGRWVHEPSGRVYNTTFNTPRVPGRDDVTGEALVQRPDDNIDVYRNRLDKFRQTSEPLLEHYARKGVLLEVEGMSSDEISPKLYKEFENRFAR
uniref:GTP:AMP phosphotransferase, mitochondrial n=1 Tax=Bionectria ochroleuca TaxID=29856 RepID=A0A0B7JQ74_BIOOC